MKQIARSLCMLVSVWLLSAQVQAADDQWAETVSKVSDSVVLLQISMLRNFGDSVQGGSNATGFVVDAERGIILTNRHVVGTGPIRFSATFQNQEQVDAVPLYRDPVHDFAFIRYNPADLKYAKPISLQLRPDKVSKGLNIRVIGSDGGEQLSILPGTIARLDREVPSYGRYGYNDYNTFYFQAASSTSGGSSGSPVIDFDGDVVALNAAANTKTASSFFLPLPRIQYALSHLQKGEPVPRGGFETIFVRKPFRELRRLGLDEQTEADARAHDNNTNGMLIVDQVIVGGVMDGKLTEGDILVAIDQKPITNFIELEALLDDNIGHSLSVEFIRQGQLQSSEVLVADLHAIEPTRFLELGDSILQEMSIQHARAMNLPRKGVVVMKSGYFFNQAGLPQTAVIIEVNGTPINDLNDFIAQIRQAPMDKKMLVRYVVPGNEFTTNIAQFDINNRWFDHSLCERVDDARFWTCNKMDLPEREANVASADVVMPVFKDELLSRVAPAMVKVDLSIPYSSDNVYASNFSGVGLILDKEAGLVVVDRNTVPVSLGDIEITFFGSLVLDAEVVFLHPRHNIALLKYDPAMLSDAQFEALDLVAADELPESLTMVGYRADGTFRRQTLDDFNRLTVGFNPPGLPRFQQSPIDLFGVSNVSPSLGGPLVDDAGNVYALYMSFAYEDGREIHQGEWAMPASVIQEALRMYRSKNPYYSLDARLGYRSIASARELGLTDEWLREYQALPAHSRRVIYVEQVVPNTDAAQKLLPGDIIIAIEGELVANLLAVEIKAQQSVISMTVLRASEVITLSLSPTPLSGLGTQRVVSWAGALFQAPHNDIGYQKGVHFPGVYIADTEQGSPALWDGLYRNRFVTEIDGQPVTDLDSLLSLLKGIEQDEVTRLTLVSMSGRKSILSVAPEYNFWPLFEITHTNNGWERINYAQ